MRFAFFFHAIHAATFKPPSVYLLSVIRSLIFLLFFGSSICLMGRCLPHPMENTKTRYLSLGSSIENDILQESMTGEKKVRAVSHAV